MAATFAGARHLAFEAALPASAQSACATTHAGLDGEEQAFLSLLNAHRQALGLNALSVNPALNAASAWKSEDQATASSFSHTDSLRRDPTARANDCGYAGGVGENIAGGFSSAQSVFDGWMRSSGHKANIENATYGTIGIGKFDGQWTTAFGLGGAPAPKPAPQAASAPKPAPQPASAPKPVAAPAPAPAPAPAVSAASAAVEPAAPQEPQPEPASEPDPPAERLSAVPAIPRMMIALPGSVNARAHFAMVSFGD